MQYDFERELERVGAIRPGHFVLASGRHSDTYIEKFALLRSPADTVRACSALIDALAELSDVDLVVGPTTGGILLACEVGRQLDTQSAYAERLESGSSTRVFKRGTVIAPDTRVLVIDDVMTTGGSILETLRALRACRAGVQAVALLVDRSGGSVDVGVPIVALHAMVIQSWEPGECPLCKQGIPIVKPGTTGITN